MTGWDNGNLILTTEEDLVWGGGDNVATNGSFETNTTGWAAVGGATLARITTDFQTGGACLKSSGSATGGITQNVNSTIGKTLNTIATGRVWVKAGNAAANGETVGASFIESGGNFGDQETVVTTTLSNTAWKELVVTHRVVRDDRDDLDFQVAFESGAESDDDLLVDNIRFYTGSFVAALKMDDGSLFGPATCYPVITGGVLASDQLQFQSDPGFDPTTTGDARERTQYAFGQSTAWVTDSRVTAVIPRGQNRVQVTCVNEDSRVHTADGETYVDTEDVALLGSAPDAPTLTGLTANLRGPQNDRFIGASWNAAAGALGYECEHGGSTGNRRMTVSWLSGSVAVGDTIRGFGSSGGGLAGSIQATAPTGNTATVTVSTLGAHGRAVNDYINFATVAQLGVITPADLSGVQKVTEIVDTETFKFIVTTALDGSGGSSNATTLWQNSGAVGTVTLAADTTSTSVEFDLVSGEFGWFDGVFATDPSYTSAEFYCTTQGGSTATSAWTSVGWTNATSIEAPYISSSAVGGDETVYVRARAVGNLRGDWVMTPATVVRAANITQSLEFDAQSGALRAGSNAAQIQYTLAQWFTHDDDTGTTTTKTMGELPANHIIQSIEIRLVEAFDASGTDVITWGHTTGDEYGTMDVSDASNTLTRGSEIGVLSATARTVTATYTYVGTAPTAGAALMIIHYFVVPSNPVTVASPSTLVNISGAEPRYAKLSTTGFDGNTTIFNDRLPSTPCAVDEVLILHMNAALVQVASSPTIGQFSLSGTGTSLNRNIEFGRAPESGDTVYALYLDS